MEIEIGTRPELPFDIAQMVNGWNAVAEGVRAFADGDPTPLALWVDSTQGRYCLGWATYFRNNPEERDRVLNIADRPDPRNPS